MLLELTDLLGRSYRLQEVNRDRAGAVALLSAAFDDSAELRQTAQGELTRLGEVIAGRGREACFITAATHDLLAAGLAGSAVTQ